MTCAACSGAVENALRQDPCSFFEACRVMPALHAESFNLIPLGTPLRAKPGVSKATVALLTERADVEFDTDVIKDPSDLVEVVEDAGFDGTLISVTELRPRTDSEVILNHDVSSDVTV